VILIIIKCICMFIALVRACGKRFSALRKSMLSQLVKAFGLPGIYISPSFGNAVLKTGVDI